jgi:hypothetical protein
MLVVQYGFRLKGRGRGKRLRNLEVLPGNPYQKISVWLMSSC